MNKIKTLVTTGLVALAGLAGVGIASAQQTDVTTSTMNTVANNFMGQAWNLALTVIEAVWPYVLGFVIIRGIYRVTIKHTSFF